MDATTAAHTLNTMACPPGYRVRALVIHNRAVEVMLFQDDVRNTNGDNAPLYEAHLWPENQDNQDRELQALRFQYLTDTALAAFNTPGDLFAWMMTAMVIPAVAHEWREFMRYQNDDGEWVAPLHPHRDDGRAAWRHHVGTLPSTYLNYAGA